MDIGMAHLGCWKSFPTDMLEIRRGQGNRHFPMSSPYPWTLRRARLSDLAGASSACRGKLRQAACRALSPDRANPAASRRLPRRPTALAGNRACSSRGRQRAGPHKKEKCDRVSLPRKAADGFLTGRLHSGEGGTNPTRVGSFTVRGELISWPNAILLRIVG